jgi:TonB family protein
VPKSGSGLEGLPIMTPAAMVRPASPQVSRLRASSVSAGDVTLRVKVDETGSPVQATVLQSADARLNTAAMDAVLQSGFTPARTAEGNVTSWVVVTVRVDPDR